MGQNEIKNKLKPVLDKSVTELFQPLHIDKTFS